MKIPIYSKIEKEFDATNNAYSSIDDVIDFFISEKKKGYTKVAWYASTDLDYESRSCDANCYGEREETEKERKEREDKYILNENIKKEKIEELRKLARQKEIDEYERLKKKYN